MREFWKRLADGWDQPVSYEAVRTYHCDRDPPVTYLVRVCKVFPDIRLEYLITGDGPMTKGEALPQVVGVRGITGEDILEYWSAVGGALAEVFPWYKLGGGVKEAIDGVYSRLKRREIPALGQLRGFNEEPSPEERKNERERDQAIARRTATAFLAPLVALGIDVGECRPSQLEGFVRGVAMGLDALYGPRMYHQPDSLTVDSLLGAVEARPPESPFAALGRVLARLDRSVEPQPEGVATPPSTSKLESEGPDGEV